MTRVPVANGLAANSLPIRIGLAASPSPARGRAVILRPDEISGLTACLTLAVSGRYSLRSTVGV